MGQKPLCWYVFPGYSVVRDNLTLKGKKKQSHNLHVTLSHYLPRSLVSFFSEHRFSFFSALLLKGLLKKNL